MRTSMMSRREDCFATRRGLARALHPKAPGEDWVTLEVRDLSKVDRAADATGNKSTAEQVPVLLGVNENLWMRQGPLHVTGLPPAPIRIFKKPLQVRAEVFCDVVAACRTRRGQPRLDLLQRNSAGLDRYPTMVVHLASTQAVVQWHGRSRWKLALPWVKTEERVAALPQERNRLALGLRELMVGHVERSPPFADEGVECNDQKSMPNISTFAA